MEYLNFISSLVESMSWPIAIVLIVVLLRKPILKMIPNLRKLKYKNVEMDFNEIRDIHDEASGKTTKTEWRLTSTKHLLPNMVDLAKKSPLAVILQAWDLYERTLINVAKISKSDIDSSDVAINYLVQNKKTHNTGVDLYYRLLALKNRFSNFEGENLPIERALEVADTLLEIAHQTKEMNKVPANNYN